MTDQPTVFEAVAQVMEDVQSVRKAERNTQQNFNFRGIDAVMNAVGPALRAHGVIVAPTAVQRVYEPIVTSKGSAMTSVRICVNYRWWGPGGDFFDTQAPGEAFDAGDKGTAKAMSVAFRTMLLQTLCLPTDEPDPDLSVYERGLPPKEQVHLSERSTDVGDLVDKGLTHLRKIAVEPDTASRIAQVASWKLTAHDLGILNHTVDWEGQRVTLERAADMVASGALA